MLVHSWNMRCKFSHLSIPYWVGFVPLLCSNISYKPSRVACPKFGHLVLSSELQNYTLNIEFVVAIGMLAKPENLKTNSLITIFVKLLFPCRNFSFKLDRLMSELRAHYPVTTVWFSKQAPIFVTSGVCRRQGRWRSTSCPPRPPATLY